MILRPIDGDNIKLLARLQKILARLQFHDFPNGFKELPIEPSKMAIADLQV